MKRTLCCHTFYFPFHRNGRQPCEWLRRTRRQSAKTKPNQRNELAGQPAEGMTKEQCHPLYPPDIE